MFDKRLVEIFLHLTPQDRVRYIAEQLDRTHSVPFKEFVSMLKNSHIPLQDREEFKKQLYSFEPIILNLKTGEWEIFKLPARTQTATKNRHQ
jgi:hypothetical protein